MAAPLRLHSFSCMFSLAGSLLALGCGDDGSTGSGSTDPTSSTTTPGSTSSPGTASDPSSSTEAAESSSTTSDDDSSSDASSSTGRREDSQWGALVLGTLFTDDLEAAQAVHDAVAMGGQADAQQAGDLAHHALLGTTLLNTPANHFLGLDRWDSLEGAQAIYGDPEFQAGFGMLFAEPPSLELFARRDEWYGWGSVEAGDGGDHWMVVVRGRLTGDDLEASRRTHDAIAMGGEDDAVALGDVAHVVWVGTPDDPQQFLAIDVWTDDAAIEAFYDNPEFQSAFGALFENPPVVGVYASTDWHQW